MGQPGGQAEEVDNMLIDSQDADQKIPRGRFRFGHAQLFSKYALLHLAYEIKDRGFKPSHLIAENLPTRAI